MVEAVVELIEVMARRWVEVAAVHSYCSQSSSLPDPFSISSPASWSGRVAWHCRLTPAVAALVLAEVAAAAEGVIVVMAVMEVAADSSLAVA